MKHLMALVCAALILGSAAFSLPALAQEQPPQITEYKDWTDHLVPGDLVRQAGDLVSAKTKTKKPPTLIKVRSHFVKEMLKSVEGL